MSDNIKNWAVEIDANAMAQVRKMATLPFIHKHIAIMPDAHLGVGSCVGTVIATNAAIIPAAVGVDLGCGMTAIELGVPIEDWKELSTLRSAIEATVPVGFNSHAEYESKVVGEGELIEATPLKDLQKRASLQLGTLGGGNHFIELCFDERGMSWLMLHSGSRNIGKEIAERHINKAKGIMKKYFISLPDPDLAYLVDGTEEFSHYIREMLWAQKYAYVNRQKMVFLVLEVLHKHLGRPLNCGKFVTCHHNFTEKENHFGKNVWVTRKGAVRARTEDYGIIPGSMGTKSYIVRGLGNVDSFASCSHGAGRRMGRGEARRNLTHVDVLSQTSGVECRKDDGIIDELPGAYKNIDQVMEAQKELVSIEHTLKQVLCVKG